MGPGSRGPSLQLGPPSEMPGPVPHTITQPSPGLRSLGHHPKCSRSLGTSLWSQDQGRS